MKNKQILLAALLLSIFIHPAVSSNCDGSYTDRLCGEDNTKIWLDIVIVVDNSKGMTHAGITAVAAQINSLFVDGQLIGTYTNEPRSTRVGIVTYNGASSVVADLNAFSSIEDLQSTVSATLNKVSTNEDSFLETGLDAANSLLQRQSFDTDRDHYKKLVIVYASEYRSSGQMDPLPLATRMKSSDITIATVAYSQDQSDAFLEKLKKIASPGYNFTNSEYTVTELRKTMLQVNCYCPNRWFQMRQNFADENSFRYGVCVSPISLKASWTASKFACRNQWNNAYLVNEFSQTKHDFVLQAVMNTSGFVQPYTYLIGLSYSGGTWNWEQPNGQSTIKVQNWSGWNPGYPTSSSTAVVGLNVQPSTSSVTSGWENTGKDMTWGYVCEVASCDSTNYCEAEDI